MSVGSAARVRLPVRAAVAAALTSLALAGSASAAFAASSAMTSGERGLPGAPKPPPQSQAPAVGTPPCSETAGMPSPGTAVPWAQQRLDFAAAWQFSQGQGITVGVVDSGVSADTPQLAGRLIERSVVDTAPGVDCQGHGTGVAGIIGAAQRQGVPFAGVAPGARILSVKATNSDGVDCGVLAAGIREAVDDGAQVVNVSTQCPSNAAGLGALRDAVRFAGSRDVVVVAAAGNDTQTGGSPPFYPANYSADPAAFPNVLSVGATLPDGSLLDVSDRSTNVSVVAPGSSITTLAPAGTYAGPSPQQPQQDEGTSFAAPFAAGVAALIRAQRPSLTAAQVVSRIVATADGGTVAGTGAGLVDPLQAVTAVLPGEAGQPTGAASPSPSMIPAPPPPPADRLGHLLVVSITGGALGAAALVMTGAVVIPAGRRRGWRPGHVEPREPPSAADDAGG